LGENTNANGLGDLHEGFDIGWDDPESGFKEQDGKQQNAARDNGVMAGGNVWPDSDQLIGFKEAVLTY
jgi:hypothetical protein